MPTTEKLLSLAYILLFILVAAGIVTSSLGEGSDDEFVKEYPYTIMCSSGSGSTWQQSSVEVDSFIMHSPTEITFYRDNTHSRIFCRQINITDK